MEAVNLGLSRDKRELTKVNVSVSHYGLGRIVFINKTQAIPVVLHFGSQKCFFQLFFLQLIDKQRQQRELCAQACLLHGQIMTGCLEDEGMGGRKGEPVHSHQTCGFSVNPGDSPHAGPRAVRAALDYMGFFFPLFLPTPSL